MRIGRYGKGTERIEQVMRRKHFRSMLTSSFFLFFLPLLLCVTAFSLYQSYSYQKEMRAAQSAALTRAAELADEQLSVVVLMPWLLNGSTSVQTLFQGDDTLLVQQEVSSVLNSYCQVNHLISDIYLYEEGDNLVYTSSKWLLLSPDTVAMTVDGAPYGEVMMQEEGMRRFVVRDFYTPYHPVGNAITYTAPVFRQGGRNAMICTVLLDTDAMEASFRSICTLADMPPVMVLLNSRDECLFSMGDEQAEAVSALLKAGDDVPQRLSLGGSRYFVSAVSSSVADWTFYLFTPEALVRADIIPHLLVLMAMVALECLALYAFMQINYHPLHHTYESIRSIIGPAQEKEAEGATDEMGDIRDTVFSLVQDLQSLNQTMISQKPALQQIFWLDVINGKFESEAALLKKAEALGLPLWEGESFMLVVQPREGEVFRPGDQGRLDELLGDYFPHRLLENINQLNSAFLCKSSESRESVAEQLTMFVEKAEQELDIRMIAGAGGLCQSYTYISHSYLEARAAVDMHGMLGTPLVMYDAIRPLLEGMWGGSKQADSYARRLESCILREDEAAIHQCFDDLDMMLETAAPPLIFLRRICFDLNVLVYNLLKKERPQALSRDRTDLMDELFCMRSKQDAALFLRKLEGQLLPPAQSAAPAPDIEQMIGYLQENYRRPDFSCNEAATRFGMQPSTFSRYFKQQTGKLPINYLTAMRMEAAKELLVHTDASLSDVVLSVGYYSTSSFIKRFREYEGMTPAAYRAANRPE